MHADTSSGTASAETVWNDGAADVAGGGVGDAFALPTWQAHAGVPHRARSASTKKSRGVPDVAGDADPRTGYQVCIDGTLEVIAGTSAAAPLWAALACRLAQAIGNRLGLLEPIIYAGAKPGDAAPGFRDVVTGSTGAYKAASGWDACTGLGSPDGEALLAVVRSARSGSTNPR